MREWLRKNFQRIFIPKDENLRREFAQFKKDVQLLVGDNVRLGLDMGITSRHNSILIIMSQQPKGDYVKHVSLDLKPREVIALLRHLHQTFGIPDRRIYMDGPPGYSHIMKSEILDD